ncbi:MAG: YfiR family protein [Pseudomonadota bacterium]
MTIMISDGLHWGAGAERTQDGAGRAGRLPALLAIALSCVLLAFVCLTAVGAQSGSQETHLERNVKAAFLYKFLGYVDYPEQAAPGVGEPLVIAILGADDVADELARISAGRNMNGRAVAVRKLRAGDAPGKVHMLFVGNDDVGDIDRALAAVRQAPVLTVTETGRNLRHDSVINFRLVDGRVRFDVSLDAVEKNNLKLSSRLLAVAYKVQRNSR